MITIPRIALFIDVENVPDSEAVGEVVRSLDSVGNLTARIAYGKSVRPKGWNDEFLRRQAIDYVPVNFITSSKKNDIVDKQLIVGAMDHLSRGKADVLALVSGDADYGALVRHARGVISEVWGFAFEDNSAADFRRGFNQFFYLDEIGTQASAAKIQAAAANVRKLVAKTESAPSAGVDIDGIKAALIAALRKKDGRLHYSELRRLVPDMKVLFWVLTHISKESNAREGILLSAVVVGAKTGIPGSGFFDMARELGREFTAGDKESEGYMWADELDKARRWAREQHEEE